MNKRLLFSALTLLTFGLSISQNYNFEEEFRRIVEVPKSPEAEAFEKYGNTPVNMYTGTPNVSIPLYTIQGRELSLPLSLTYDASGVKVRQMATGAGLGWNLNAGGRISRITNGLVDDWTSISNHPYTTVLYNGPISNPIFSSSKSLKQLISENIIPPQNFGSLQEGIDHFKFLKAIGDNYLDVQPDYFSFSALGISDHFVYDMNSGAFVALDNPRIKVAPYFSATNYIESWTVTNDDGTTFYFDLAEKTHTIGSDASSTSTVVQEFYSSWVLTKIESPNRTDVYEFEYEDFNNVLIDNRPSIITTTITNELDNPNPETDASLISSSTEYKIAQLTLVRVKHNSKTVVDISLKSRNDFELASAIDKIDIKRPDGNLLKSYKFNHSYFGDANSQFPDSKRLKLDSIEIKSLNNALSSYGFEYFSPASVPTLVSKSIDYIGLYNGRQNSVLYPAVSVSGLNFSGSDRSPDFNYAIIGTLSKIKYPTGGYSEFLFEPNKTTYTTNDISSSTQDVTRAYLSLTGGIDNWSTTCGACCTDEYGAGGPPKTSAVIFTIEESEVGNYFVEHSNDMGSYGEAYLFKRTVAIKPNTPTLPYDQVIDQSNCMELVDLIWSNFYSMSGSQVYLDAGTYQITLAKGGNYLSPNNISLRVHREEITNNNTVGTGEVIRAGFRILSIKDYSAQGVLSTEKEYIYKTEINGLDSSGELLFEPIYYTTHVYTMWAQEDNPELELTQGVNTRHQMRRGESWSGGDRPNIAYATVIERQKASGSDNGYVEHHFNVEPHVGVYSTGVSPNANLYANYFGSGKESGMSVFSSDGTIKSSEGTSYYDKSYFGNSTIYLYNNPENNYNYIKIYPGPGNLYYYDYVEARISGFTGPFGPGGSINPIKPSDCDAPNYCMPLEYSTFETRNTYAQGRAGGISSSTKQDFFTGDTITNYMGNTYDSALNYLPRQSKTWNSLGDTIVTKHYYPKDYQGTQVYDEMISKNRLNTVVKSKAYYLEGDTIATKETTYKEWFTNKYFPEFIKTSKGNLGLENRIQVHSYYSNGNVKEASQYNGTWTVYLWGYDNQYLIAKIENATYPQIESLPYFGTNFSITNGLSANQQTSLRNNLVNAVVTTFDYDPLIGVTSITDPKGYATYYEYDEFNRLSQVKDADGKILRENQYHYKN